MPLHEQAEGIVSIFTVKMGNFVVYCLYFFKALFLGHKFCLFFLFCLRMLLELSLLSNVYKKKRKRLKEENFSV